MKEPIVRWMKPTEQVEVEALAQQDKKTGKEFIYVWTHWASWAKHPPVVVFVAEQLVGYHAVQFGSRSPRYANSLYQLVEPKHRGQGLGVRMVDFILREAYKADVERLRFACSTDDGKAFWGGLGAKPFARNEKGDLYYDIDLDEVRDVPSFIEALKTRGSGSPMPAAKRAFYERKSLTWLNGGEAR